MKKYISLFIIVFFSIALYGCSIAGELKKSVPSEKEKSDGSISDRNNILYSETEDIESDVLLSILSKNKYAKVNFDSTIFLSEPNFSELAKEYDYVLVTMLSGSGNGYFEKTQYNLDDNGNIESKYYVSGNIYGTAYIPSDEHIYNLTDLTVTLESEDFYNIYFYTYDEFGRVIEELVYDRFDSHKKPAYIRQYEYEDDGTVTKSTYSYDTRSLEHTSREVHDVHDNIIEDSKGNISEYEYDRDGNVVSKTRYYEYDTVYYSYEYSMENPQKFTRVSSANDGSVERISTYWYHYDDKGNLITITYQEGNEFEENPDLSNTIFSYTYNEEGLLINSTSDHWDSDELKEYTYEYYKK